MLKNMLVCSSLLISGITFAGQEVGTWASDCAADENGEGYSASLISIGSDGSYSGHGGSYSDSNCSQVSIDFTVSGKYLITGASSTVANAENVTITPQKTMLTVSDEQLVSFLNQQNFCGGGFTKDVTKDVSACDQFNKPSYDIQKVEGDKLYSGQFDRNHDGSSPQKRPVEINNQPMHRK